MNQDIIPIPENQYKTIKINPYITCNSITQRAAMN